MFGCRESSLSWGKQDRGGERRWRKLWRRWGAFGFPRKPRRRSPTLRTDRSSVMLEISSLDFQESQGGDLQHYWRPVCTFTFSLFLCYLCMNTLVLRLSLDLPFVPSLFQSHFTYGCPKKSGFLEFYLFIRIMLIDWTLPSWCCSYNLCVGVQFLGKCKTQDPHFFFLWT